MRRNKDKVKDYAMRHGIEKYYTDANSLINDAQIHAIYIATPPDTHLFYGLKVAAAGKVCCIEKPLTPSYKYSKKIEIKFKKNNTPLFVAYYRRSLPRFKEVRKRLLNNEIGDVRHINWHLSKLLNTMDLSGN